MRETVAEGYEKGKYLEVFRSDREVREPEQELFGQLFERLPENPAVLDLGCGNGLPFDRYMVENGCDVTGVDVVQRYVEQARENVPDASFLQSDLIDLDVEPNSFDAVTSFYAVFHVPRDRHEQLFRKINRWLRPGGMLLVTVGAGEEFEGTDEFAGVEMAWSYYSGDKSLSLIEEAGFEIRKTYEEQRGDEHHLWVLAKKP